MRSLLCFALALSLAGAANACELDFESGWIGDAPPTSTMRAGYLRIVNAGSSDVTITAASSPAFARVEMHETTEQDGVTRMRKLDPAVVPAQGELRFVPSGKHFMLINPTATLAQGDQIELVIDACAKQFSTQLRVGAPADADHADHPDHAQHDHDHSHQH